MIPTDPSTDVFWTMLEAIGTITASIVALFSVLYFELIKPSRNRPALRLKFEDVPPYSSLTNLNIAGRPPRVHTSIARLIRIGVLNTSKVPARGVRLKFRALAGDDLEAHNGLIPYDLPWVDIEGSRREILSKDEEAYVEFIVGVKDDPEAWWFQPYDPSHSIGFGNLAGLPQTPEPPFTAHAELVACAENLETPAIQVFEITYDKPATLGIFNMKMVDKQIHKPQYVSYDEAVAMLQNKKK
jgi:hypothetical protein